MQLVLKKTASIYGIGGGNDYSVVEGERTAGRNPAPAGASRPQLDVDDHCYETIRVRSTVAATQRHAKKRWRISKSSGSQLHSRLNPFGGRTKTETSLFSGTR